VRAAPIDDEVVDGAAALSQGRVNREHAFEEAAARSIFSSIVVLGALLDAPAPDRRLTPTYPCGFG